MIFSSVQFYSVSVPFLNLLLVTSGAFTWHEGGSESQPNWSASRFRCSPLCPFPQIASTLQENLWCYLCLRFPAIDSLNTQRGGLYFAPVLLPEIKITEASPYHTFHSRGRIKNSSLISASQQVSHQTERRKLALKGTLVRKRKRQENHSDPLLPKQKKRRI